MSPLVDKWRKSKIRKNAFVIESKFVLFINLIYFYFVFMLIKINFTS